MRAAREARFTTAEIHHIRGGVTHLYTYVVVAQGEIVACWHNAFPGDIYSGACGV